MRGIDQSVSSLDELANINRSSTPAVSRVARSNLRGDHDDAWSRQRVKRVIEAQSRQIRDRTIALSQREAENRSLQSELDELRAEYEALERDSTRTTEILNDVLRQLADSNGEAFDTEIVASASDDVETLNAALAIDNARQQVVDEQLQQANAKIAELEFAVFQEIAYTTEATQALILTGAPVVPVLAELISDEDPGIRRWAIQTLAEIGSDAEPALEALMAALEDDDASVRRAAQFAIDRIEGRS